MDDRMEYRCIPMQINRRLLVKFACDMGVIDFGDSGGETILIWQDVFYFL
jgi:hypothetical protein